MSYLWDGLVRRFSSKSTGTQNPLRLTTLESLAITEVEGQGAELLRAGARFVGGCQVIANGIAPVTAVPTTTATLLLYNTASDGGKSIVLNRIGFSLGSGTPTAGASLFLTVTAGKPAAVPGAATNYSSQSANGGTSLTSIARWATGITIPSGSAWVLQQASFQLAAANVGQGDVTAVRPGMFLIRPGYGLGIAILSGTGTTPLYLVSAEWDELQLDLE